MRRRSSTGGAGEDAPAADDRRRRFEELVVANSAALLGYARRRVEQPADAADVVCDVFLVAWRRLDDVPPGRNGTLWLYGVARRALSNHRRSGRRREALAEKLQLQLQLELRHVEPHDEPFAEPVHRALARLSAADRELLTLTAWEGLSTAELAEVLDLSPGAVRVRLHRARSRFKEKIEPEGPVTHRAAVGHGKGGPANAGPGTEEAT